MKQETKQCQNCKHDFCIEPEDFDFYTKLKVPPPTWCSECRMIRRFVWRNERVLFKRKDSVSGQIIFSSIPAESAITVYDRHYWLSDAWDPMTYGRAYDFSRPFFEQFHTLASSMPWPSRQFANLIEADYSNNVTEAKNAYLCFAGNDAENSAYVVEFNTVKEGFDLYQSRHSELCYDCYMVDEAYRVFYSVNCEECTDIWFSKNLLGCNNCFGCINLRNKNYHLFNKSVSKEEYQAFLAKFASGSFAEVIAMRKQCEALWKTAPHKYVLSIQAIDSTGEHIEHVKNVKRGFFIHEGEHLAYSQIGEVEVADCYDCTIFRRNISESYECCGVVDGVSKAKFVYYSYPSINDVEYSMECHASSNLFGCFGLQKKQYCIFNKQYSKEDYHTLREKIITHMTEMPYTDKQERVYRYGEFFPPEFSPFAYNETIAQDFFPLTKEDAKKKGYLWREPNAKEYETTIKATDLPDNIRDVKDDVLKELIACEECGKAYRIIRMELDFYRRIPLPLPRKCPDCRFAYRFQFVNPPKFWSGKCQCTGQTDDRNLYTNQNQNHFHAGNHCPNEFETSYAPGRPEIVYCEACYNAEVA